MRKLICLITLIISLIAIITMSITFNDVINAMGGINIDFSNMSFRQVLNSIGLFSAGIFGVFGTSLILLVVSVIGLTLPSRKKQLSN
jgi:hypothetical protein